MTYENVRFNKGNFTVAGGYFYMFDYQLDSLVQKTDDGNTSFSYPLDTLLTKDIDDSEFDGVYFWTVEEGATSTDIVIRRWFIDNYICKLQETFTYTHSGSHSYDTSAFSIEHFHTTFSGTTVSGVNTIYVNDYYNHYSMEAGTILHLGPNSSGDYEDVTVTGTLAHGINLTSNISYTYADGDPINYYTNLWVFNNYDGVDGTTGALYKFDAHTGDYITKYSSGAYKDVLAATFYNVDSFADYGSVDTLCYVKGTNLLFIDVSGETLPYYGSMVMDNVNPDEVTLISIYAISMYSQNVYRLQQGATYYGSYYPWAPYYNYQLSSLDPFVFSISLSAAPAMIAANLVSKTGIAALVKDQFLQPVASRTVQFTHNGDGSITGGSSVSTDADGEADTVYTSGSTAREVTITAVVEQT